MSELNCQLEAPQTQGAPVNVGDRMSLNCDGEIGATLKSNAQFVFENKAHNYILHILEVTDSTTNSFKATVTSYQPGEFSGAMKISDGENTIQTSELKWKVESILNPQEKPQPFPSKGPYLLSYPLWLWLGLAAIVAAISGLIFLLVWRRRRHKKLMEELESYKTMLSPISEFSKDVRKVMRDLSLSREDSLSGEVVDKIDRDFRLYLIRELMVPALQYSDSDIVDAIKKQHRGIYQEYHQDFRRVFSELSKAKGVKDRLKIKDGEDLTFLTRKLVENIYSMRRKTK